MSAPQLETTQSDTPPAEELTPPSSFFAFISYASEDATAATWLQQALESYRIPRKLVGNDRGRGVIPRRLFPIARDRTDIAADDGVRAGIAKILTDSRALIVMCSPDAARSHHVGEEIDDFLAARPKGAVVTVIVR